MQIRTIDKRKSSFSSKLINCFKIANCTVVHNITHLILELKRFCLQLQKVSTQIWVNESSYLDKIRHILCQEFRCSSVEIWDENAKTRGSFPTHNPPCFLKKFPWIPIFIFYFLAKIVVFPIILPLLVMRLFNSSILKQIFMC